MGIKGAMLWLAGLLLITSACGVSVGKRAPDWSFQDTTGTTRSLSDHGGEVRLLYFWATWCAPCASVGQRIQQLHERFGGHGLKIYAVHFDDQSPAAEYAVEKGYAFTVIPQGRELAKLYGVSKLPTVLIIDEAGKLSYRQSGFNEALLDDLSACVAAELAADR